ncbi:MAG: hypothetical protein M3Y58_14125 [Chloroflexota bacterium]|nr:hypothetical protein [Chloroflexota bacterium]
MDNSETPAPDRISVKKRLVLAIFSAAYWLATVSIANLYLWQKEVRNRFVHYTTKTVESLGGIHPVIVASLPSPTKRTRRIEFALRTAEDWRDLRGFIASDVRAIARDAGTLDQAQAAIQAIEREAMPTSADVRDSARDSRLSAHA